MGSQRFNLIHFFPATVVPLHNPVSRCSISLDSPVSSSLRLRSNEDRVGITGGPMERGERLKLIVIKGADEGKQFELADPVVGIGRDAGNAIRLNDTEVSRRHAELYQKHSEGNRYFLRDVHCALRRGVVQMAGGQVDPLLGLSRLGRVGERVGAEAVERQLRGAGEPQCRVR